MGHNPMVDTTASYRQSITARLASARQSLALLQSQLRAGVADPAYWVDRIDDLIELFELLGEERAANDQQRRLAAVYEVSRVLGTSLDLDEVLNQVMDAIIHLTGAERGFLMLFDTGAEPEIRVARNMEREALDDEASGISRSVINLVVETGEQVVTTNATRDPRFYDQPSVVAHHLRSILCVPLQARGSLIGVIYVDNRIRSGVFDEADLEMLTTFATQAAMAIENARLFTMTDEALSRRVEELQQLQEIDRQLNETLDFDRVMQLTLDWAVRVTGADNGAIGLFDVEERRTRVIAQHGPSPQAAIAMLSGADEPASGLIVPVRREGRTIGVIALDRESGQPFDDEARDFVTRMADHAAIAIENARLYEAVQEANRAKSEFVSVTTHELRVPLTSIKGYADILSVVGELNEEQRRFTETIKNNVTRMTMLMDDLSDISRIETGRMKLELKEGVRFADVLNPVLDTLQAQIDQLGHRLEVDVPPDLPPLTADPHRLTQVLTNLLSNACKYTPPGGAITVSARAYEGVLQVDVSDSGIGMTAEELDRLFTKFWRSERAEVRDQPGTGLGLAITRTLVEMHGGEMFVTSEKDVGSTFTFTLPLGE
mgnify:FL=1